MSYNNATYTASSPTVRAPDLLRAFLRTDDGSVGLIGRLTLAIVIFPHGAQKAFGWFGGAGLGGTVDFFGSLGVPALIAVLIIAAEVAGPLLLAVGAATRFVAASIGMIMVGAVALVHGSNGFFMNWFGNQPGEGFEFHLLALGLAVGLVIRGAGRWSVDRRLHDAMA